MFSDRLGVAHAIPSIAFIGPVYRRARLLVSPTIPGVQLTDQQRPTQAPGTFQGPREQVRQVYTKKRVSVVKTWSRITVTLLVLLMGIRLLASSQLLGSPQEADPLALTPEMVAVLDKLDKNVVRDTDPRKQLHALLDVLFDSSDLGFKYSSATHTAAEAFERQHGDCLSFTNMFIGMARHLGWDVRFREVETVPVWEQRGGVFTVSLHVNAAVNMGSRQFVVDLSPELQDAGMAGTIVSDERGLAHFYNNRAMERLVRGDFEGASAHLDRALELEPDAPFLWTNLGVLRSRAANLEGAEHAYLKALELDSDHLPAMSNLESVYRRLHEPERAEHYRQQARRFREQNPYYHYHLGRRASTSGDLQEALKRYKQSVKLKPEEHRFQFALAQVFTRLGEADRALHHLKKAGLYASDESDRLYYEEQRQLLAQR